MRSDDESTPKRQHLRTLARTSKNLDFVERAESRMCFKGVDLEVPNSMRGGPMLMHMSGSGKVRFVKAPNHVGSLGAGRCGPTIITDRTAALRGPAGSADGQGAQRAQGFAGHSKSRAPTTRVEADHRTARKVAVFQRRLRQFRPVPCAFSPPTHEPEGSRTAAQSSATSDRYAAFGARSRRANLARG